MKPTYAVGLWDHEVEPAGDWSAELAQQVIGQNINLNRQQLADAIRTLLKAGWSDVSVFIQRENPELDIPLEERQAAFRQWAETVRDPAEAAAEGTRTLWARNGGAYAEYNIANLETFWAFNTRLEYKGLMGASGPWAERQTREECLEGFLERAKSFFANETHDMSQLHKDARRSMLELLNPSGLFGFTEPLPNLE